MDVAIYGRRHARKRGRPGQRSRGRQRQGGLGSSSEAAELVEGLVSGVEDDAGAPAAEASLLLDAEVALLDLWREGLKPLGVGLRGQVGGLQLGGGLLEDAMRGLAASLAVERRPPSISWMSPSVRWVSEGVGGIEGL